MHDLFELSRIESSALRLTSGLVSGGEVDSGALSGAAPVASPKGVHPDSSLEEPVPVVEVGAAELRCIVRNLLGKSAAPGLAIERGPADAHHGQIAVRDESGGRRSTVRLPLP